MKGKEVNTSELTLNSYYIIKPHPHICRYFFILSVFVTQNAFAYEQKVQAHKKYFTFQKRICICVDLALEDCRSILIYNLYS